MRRRDIGVLALTEGLLVVPVAVDLLSGGMSTPFRYFAADAFYYFTVARNFAETGVATYDRTFPTNGFHPLWQLWTALLYRITLALSLPETAFLYLVLVSGVLFIAVGVLLVALAIVRARGELPVLFALLPVGFLAIPMMPVWLVAQRAYGLRNPFEGPTPLYGTLWSYVNGMESCLAILMFGALAYAYVSLPRERVSSAVAVGLATSLLVLARLDLALVVAPLALVYVLAHARRHDHACALAFAACAGIPVALYLGINRAYAGAWMPVSGALKSTFPWPTSVNLDTLFFVLLKPFGFPIWLDIASRLAQILLPAAAAALALVQASRGRSATAASDESTDDLDRFLLWIGAGVVALALYDMAFTDLVDVGHWYFPVSVLWLSLLALCYTPLRLPRIGVADAYVTAAVVPIAVAVFVVFHRVPGYHAEYANFYLVEAPEVREHYGDSPPKIVELDDGIVAFSTRFPAMSGLGFTLDAAAAERYKRGEQLDVCLERGYSRLASLAYGDFHSPEDANALCERWIGADPAALGIGGVTVEYVAPSGDFGIVRLERGNAAGDR